MFTAVRLTAVNPQDRQCGSQQQLNSCFLTLSWGDPRYDG